MRNLRWSCWLCECTLLSVSVVNSLVRVSNNEFNRAALVGVISVKNEADGG